MNYIEKKNCRTELKIKLDLPEEITVENTWDVTSHDTDNIVGPQWLMDSYAPAVYWKNNAGAHNQIIIREEIMADWAKRWAWLK